MHQNNAYIDKYNMYVLIILVCDKVVGTRMIHSLCMVKYITTYDTHHVISPEIGVPETAIASAWRLSWLAEVMSGCHGRR